MHLISFEGELITANKDIALGQYGEEWKRQRKIAYTAMRYLCLILACIGRNLNLLSQNFKSKLLHL